MSVPSPVANAVRAPRRSILLIVSLCLNVALVAMIVVGIANAIRNPRSPPHLFTPQSLMANASAAERVKIRSIINLHAAKIDALKRADESAREAALRQFDSPNLTPSEFAKAIDGVLVADEALRQEETQVVVEAVGQLSAPERQSIAARARRRLAWWHFFRGHLSR